MKMTWLGALFALVFGLAGALSAAELRDVVVESVDEEAGTVTISGITYQLGDVDPAGLVPGLQVNIEYEDTEEDVQVLESVVPQN